MNTAPYGTWQSSISAQQVASSSKVFFHTVGDGEYIYNVEMRPEDAGRHVIVRYAPDGSKQDVLPSPYSARSKLHEYGGKSFTVHNQTIYFVNYADQNLYNINPRGEIKQLTNSGVRFAELTMSAYGLIAVAEQHYKKSVQNFIALIDINSGEISSLTSGDDFYAFPTLNKNSTQLAWISWNHPNMPWDATKLCVAPLADIVFTESNYSNKLHQCIMEHSTPQSFFQPEWVDDNNLIFITDITGWWNFYIWKRKDNHVFQLNYKEAEFAKPLWVLGSKTWGFVNEKILCTYIENGITKMALFDPTSVDRELNIAELPFTNIDNLCIHNEAAYFIGSSPTIPPSLAKFTFQGELSILSNSLDLSENHELISVPQHIKFPTPSRQKHAYAYFYSPINTNYVAPHATKPPLIVFLHGGPTSAAISSYNLQKQFWTSRGFAIVDINYGGSSGYGKQYRKSLQRDKVSEPGYWGAIDVQDCIACVEYLIENNLVDPNMIVVRGGSAGGFTTLALLAASKIFKAGTSYYGVTDIASLRHDTHKFESRYMDQLVGDFIRYADIYAQRSPINNAKNITCPVLVLQGSEDKVVLPKQSEDMVAKLQENGVRVEYKLYQGEQHGFRKSETIVDALTRELAFYLSIMDPNLTSEKKRTNALKATLT